MLYLKDILNLSKILSQKNRDSLEQVHSVSREGATLLRAALGFEHSQTHLKKENLHFSNTITPAILHEIQSGQTPPYTFLSTMIRIDLNGYTQIFLEKKDEYISKIMNDYFIKAREIIERYQGLIYQYVGDEIVFHIKDSKTPSSAMAVACIRSLCEVAEAIEKALPADAEHYFKIKSCLATGKMRFVHLDTGYGLSGLPLIETARLLTQIEDKTKNSVCFYEQAHEEFAFLCEIEERKAALFKGFQNQTQIGRTSAFKDVHHFLQKGDFQKLTYFRSDSDLIAICKYFTKHLSMETESQLFIFFSHIKNLRLKLVSDELIETFTGLFEVAAQRNREQWLSDKALSTVIAMVSSFVPAHKTNERLVNLLNECLEHPDHRTCANAILVLGDLSKDPSFLREFIHSENNRVSADAMLVTGKRALDKELADRLESYIKSRNPLLQASGIFVARELVHHFKHADAVYFETNEELQRLKNLLPPEKKKAA
jgi:adenylate cyclase